MVEKKSLSEASMLKVSEVLGLNAIEAMVGIMYFPLSNSFCKNSVSQNVIKA